MRPGVSRESASPETPRTEAIGVSGSDRERLVDGEENRSFADLRGVRWRIDLGILPMSSSTDELRRVTANCRRRYARLRRSLLVDPHFRKDVNSTPEVVIDDPLSQNPDSMWGRFFRSAELEKTVDQDLSRLYQEHGSYFQTPMCQSMLRRILLLWCLRHPECGYRQGMHELLAPFLYVLHVDAEQLSDVRNKYKDQFTEHFEDLAFPSYDPINDAGMERFSNSKDDRPEAPDSHRHPSKHSCFDGLDPKVQTIISLSDAYGAEGELGIVLSLKFMEHDAYCMFDALMSGSHGTVAMSDFFSPAPAGGSHTGLPPIIEASSALYHLLSIADSSLHSHLIELGVEPQYFALRWLRVLFGREFSLVNLLQIWDEIFASDNSKLNKGIEDTGSTFAIFTSPRGAFIAALGLSMILHLRSSLLASETATSCLQRLLNFPDNVSLNKLIGKAKSLKTFAMEANASSPMTLSKGFHYRSKSMFVTGHILSNTISPTTALSVVPESYWEDKWRFIQKAEELSQNSSAKKVPSNKKRWSDKVKYSLSRTESDPSSLKVKKGMKEQSSSLRRNLLADLSTELGLDKDDCNSDSNESHCMGNDSPRLRKEEKGKICTIQNEGCSVNDYSYNKEENVISVSANTCGRPNEQESDSEKSVVEIDVIDLNCTNQDKDTCLSGNSVSEENNFLFSASACPCSKANDLETGSERSSVASNLSADDSFAELNNGTCEAGQEVGPSSFSGPLNATPPASENNNDMEVPSVSKLKDRKPSGKFQWFWRFGRNAAGEEISETGSPENSKSSTEVIGPLKATNSNKSYVDGRNHAMIHKEITTLKNLGQSMVESIQVIESVLVPDNGRATSTSKIVDQGQMDVVAALRELRKISNLLSDM
ncbi:unnamed protein product [Rhodiola kirilowii]